MKLDELRAVNAFFGFCVPNSGTWPSTLFELGYEVVGVEREITARMDGQSKTRIVDFACGSGEQNHILCVEAKSRSLDLGQAQTYAAVQPSDFVDQLWLTANFRADTLERDLTYVTGSDDCDHVIRSLAEFGIDFPVIGCDGTRFDLESGAFMLARIDTLFREGIPLSIEHEWPDHHVRFKSDSGDAVIVTFVMAAVAGFVLQGNSFTIDDVCSRAVGHWQLCGQTEKKAFRRNISKLIDRAAREELKSFMRRVPTVKGKGAPREWEPMKGRLSMPQQVDSLQRSANHFATRVRLGMPFQDQPTLFDEDEEPN